jgi:hypothetical protein
MRTTRNVTKKTVKEQNYWISVPYIDKIYYFFVILTLFFTAGYVVYFTLLMFFQPYISYSVFYTCKSVQLYTNTAELYCTLSKDVVPYIYLHFLASQQAAGH